MASAESPTGLHPPAGNKGAGANIEMKSLSMVDLRTSKNPTAKKMSTMTLNYSRDYLAEVSSGRVREK